jgi:hypothetical protein
MNPAYEIIIAQPSAQVKPRAFAITVTAFTFCEEKEPTFFASGTIARLKMNFFGVLRLLFAPKSPEKSKCVCRGLRAGERLTKFTCLGIMKTVRGSAAAQGSFFLTVSTILRRKQRIAKDDKVSCGTRFPVPFCKRGSSNVPEKATQHYRLP